MSNHNYYNAPPYQHYYQQAHSMMPPLGQVQPQYEEEEDQQNVQQYADESDVIPTNMRQLRACLTCGLVKTTDQFKANGCENCSNKDDDPLNNTSTSFEGLICLMNPSKSWVARYQNLQDKVEGVYAITVHGSTTE
ncbi:hypothetical protein FDP41_002357 [Naegleria fowleri]|uniref:Spt4/RpoE2 zinc finger domain-containing protein n=1 Tax=Naegleria fowleri TaxID=5763 RepID=A0A6A5BNB4_NAEFO|nr:uncharacterized protein FDP41_002357 [Naegleria fowleri]KAF0978537.1 hypothetical protein FDP41_002357 [Naegleria fowleri]CAG4708379.1 unnamed protein product [Naegleria fowleri]